MLNLRSFASIASLALACAMPVAAHADVIETLNATLVNGGTVTGTISFGFVTVPNNPGATPATVSGYEITANNFTVVSNGDSYKFLNDYSVGGTNNAPYSAFFLGNGSYFLLDLPGSVPLAALPNGNICSTSSPCESINYLGTDFGAVNSSFIAGVDSSAVGSGTLSATPEPSSLVLLGTGILGAAGAARRRFLKK